MGKERRDVGCGREVLRLRGGWERGCVEGESCKECEGDAEKMHYGRAVLREINCDG